MPNLDDAIRELRRDVAPEGVAATWAVERFITKLRDLNVQPAPPALRLVPEHDAA